MASQLVHPDCRPRVIEAVRQLTEFPDNWDGYHAKAIAPDLIVGVVSFLERLPEEFFLHPEIENASPMPAIVPMSSGAIQLEWHSSDRILELEFETPRTIHYLKWCPQEFIEEEGSYPISELSKSLLLITWVVSGHDSR